MSPGSTSRCPCDSCRAERQKPKVNEWLHLKKEVEDFRRRVTARGQAGLFRNQIVSIQPMKIPVGGVFYMDYAYPTMKAEEPWIDF